MLVKPSEVAKRFALGVIDVGGTEWTVVVDAGFEKSHWLKELGPFTCVKSAPTGNAKLEYTAYEQRSSHGDLSGKYLVPHLITTKAVKKGDEIVLAKQSQVKKLRTKL